MSYQAASIHDVMLSLLEERTAKAFIDEYIGPELPFDASRVNWIATANSTEAIPEPLLSRFRIFEIGPFPEARLPDLVSRLLKKILEGLGLEGAVSFCVRDEAIESLRARTAREIRQLLEGAVAKRLIDIPEGFPAGTRLVLRKQDFAGERKTATGAKIGFKRF
jgi:ATP-dependent Lon protease